MQGRRHKQGGTGAGFTLRAAFVHLLLLAFIAQGLVFETHFHFGGHGIQDVSVSGATHGPSSHDHGGLPCFICQAASLSGAFVAGDLSFVQDPRSVHARVAWIGDEIGASATPAHHWLSRGPPAA